MKTINPYILRGFPDVMHGRNGAGQPPAPRDRSQNRERHSTHQTSCEHRRPCWLQSGPHRQDHFFSGLDVIMKDPFRKATSGLNETFNFLPSHALSNHKTTTYNRNETKPKNAVSQYQTVSNRLIQSHFVRSPWKNGKQMMESESVSCNVKIRQKNAMCYKIKKRGVTCNKL